MDGLCEEPTTKPDDPCTKYRSSVAKRYLLNKESAVNIKEQVQLAQEAGAKGAEDLARPARPGNAQRSMMRALLRGCKAPPLYWAKVPCHNPSTGEDMVHDKTKRL